jgi:hypothetical protein
MHIDFEQQVRERAYQIWEREGRVHGRDEEHWHSAKLELTAASHDASPITLASPGAAAEAPKKGRTRTKAPEAPPPATAAPARKRRAPARPVQ